MADPGKPKDRWDKCGVVLHPVGGLLTALAVTFVGMKGSQLLEHRQSVDTNARLYSELMSRREEAESSLRKDMLVAIINSFLAPQEGDLDSKVLNLELLAYNFHDSLDLRPLFLDLQRRIQRSSLPYRAEYLQRINTVAREITDKQIFAIEGHGAGFRRTIDFQELAAAGKAGIALEPERLDVRGTACDVSLRALSTDMERQLLNVRLEVTTANGDGEPVNTRATFDVGFFDFPMIDNTRLANGVRCAVTLTNFNEMAADLRTVCFPGEYASLKDRPYYDEVIQKLQQAAREAQQASILP
jgi:hypothetical protein